MKTYKFVKICLLVALSFTLCFAFTACFGGDEGENNGSDDTGDIGGENAGGETTGGDNENSGGETTGGDNENSGGETPGGDNENSGGETPGGDNENSGGENTDGESGTVGTNFDGCVLGAKDTTEGLGAYYTVLVLDGKGAPLNNLIVTLEDSFGEAFAQMPTGAVPTAQGRADFMNVTSGKYRVSVTAPSGKKYDYSDNLLVDDTNKNIVIKLYDPLGKQNATLYGQIEESKAYIVSNGVYLYNASEGQKQYFVIHPSSSGVFEVSVDDINATVELNGDPNYVLAIDITEDEYRIGSSTIRFEVPPVATGGEVTPFVVSVFTPNAATCVLSVVKYSELPPKPEYQEWNNVTARGEVKPFVLHESAVLQDIDITDMTLSVSLGDDGFYYTNDGKKVYIRLGSASAYLDPIALIAGHIDENVGTTFGGYIYNDEGDYVRKDRFNSLIGTYYENSDPATAVYPLTEELATAILVHGNHNGWFDKEAPGYLFGEVGVPVNEENLWLFACCTAN